MFLFQNIRKYKGEAKELLLYQLFTCNKFVKGAGFTIRFFILIKKIQLALIEFFKEVIPANFLKFVAVAMIRKMDPQNSVAFFFACTLYFGRNTISRFGPPSNLFMIVGFF